MLGSNIRRVTGQSRSSPVPDLSPSLEPHPFALPQEFVFNLYVFLRVWCELTVACYKPFVTFLFVWGRP